MRPSLTTPPPQVRNEVDRRMLRFECPRCGRPPGHWCVTRNGNWPAMLHAGRSHAARAAGLLPLPW